MCSDLDAMFKDETRTAEAVEGAMNTFIYWISKENHDNTTPILTIFVPFRIPIREMNMDKQSNPRSKNRAGFFYVRNEVVLRCLGNYTISK